MARLVALLLCLLTAACLTTPRPVFDATNSVPAGASPAFMTFVERWEARAGRHDSPRALIADGARVVELDGPAIVQEPKEDGSADYYLLGTMGGRPVACVLNDVGLAPLAEAHGVTLAVERAPGSDPAMPAPVFADGGDAALFRFIVAAFADAALGCTSVALGG